MRGRTSWPCCRSRTALSAAAMARLLFGKLTRSSRSFFKNASSSSVGDGCAAAASVTGGMGCAVAASVLAGLDLGGRSASSARPAWVVRSRRRRLGACPSLDKQVCSNGNMKQSNSAAVFLAHTSRMYHMVRRMPRDMTSSLLFSFSISLFCEGNSPFSRLSYRGNSHYRRRRPTHLPLQPLARPSSAEEQILEEPLNRV